MNEEQVTVRTKIFGDIPIYRKDLIYFVSSIEGFEDYRHYVLLAIAEAAGLFWLQSAEKEDLAFIVAVPRLFKDDYDPLMLDPDEVYRALELTSPEDLRCLALVGFDADYKNLTMNLQTPLFINTTNRKAMLALSSGKEDGEYPIHFR